MDIQNCLETTIFTAAKHVRNNGYSKLMLGVLKTSLSTVMNNEVELSVPMKNELMEVILHICKSFELVEVLTEEEFYDLLNTVTLILDFLSRNKLYVVQSVYSDIVTEAKMILMLPLTDILNHCSSLIKRMRLIEVLLNSVTEYEVDTELYVTFSSTLREVIIRALLSGERSLITYALSLFSDYCKLTKCSSSLQQIWLQVSMKALADNSYIETYLIILTHLLHSRIDEEEKWKVLNTPDFWAILKQCFGNFGNIRKYALCVLKYVVFRTIDGKLCAAHGVWDNSHSKECSYWWKTYFIIVENLDEKQSHLVLPIFGMIQDLLCSNIRIDMFWMLNLLQYAMMHDSRIVRIEAFLCLFKVKPARFEKSHLPLLTRMVLDATNDSVLFRKIFKTENFEKFRSQFVDWITEFSSQENGSYFNELMFRNIIGLKWSPIPLYYVLEFISVSITVQSTLELETSKHFVLSVTGFHNVAVRSAVQCLYIKLLAKSCERDLETVPVFLETLNCFNENECLQRGIPAWIDVVEYLKQSADVESAETLLLSRLTNTVKCSQQSPNNVLSVLARDTLLLHDAFNLLENSHRIRECFLEMIRSFSSARLKPYLNTNVQDNYLRLLVHVLSFASETKKSYSDSAPIKAMLRPHSTDILAYTIHRMMKTGNFVLLDFYAFCLDELFTRIDINIRNLEHLLSDTLFKLSCNFPRRDNPSIYSFSTIILWIYTTVFSYPKMTQARNFKNIIAAGFVDFVRTNQQRSFILECDLKNEAENAHLTTQSNYTNIFWKLFAVFAKLEHEKLTEYFDTSTIFGLIFECFDVSRTENLAELLQALRFILRNKVLLENEELVIRVMDEGWKRLKEMQATPYYFGSLECWIGAFFQKSVFESPMCRSKLCYYTTAWLKKAAEDGGHSYRNVILILKQLEEIDDLFAIHAEIVNVLVNAFCVAHVSRKDQRIEKETVARIRSSQDDSFINRISEFDFMYASEEMRLRALNLLLKSIKSSKNPVDFCQTIVDLLTSTNDSNKKRYFNDSLFHRTKNRKLQLLLIFETVLYHVQSESLAFECYERMYDFVVHSLLVEPHQPSVRYMLEWLLMRIVVHHPSHFEDRFWHSFSEASEERIGSICSFISVAFHLAIVFNTNIFIDKAVQSTLPWTMAQHFNARLYAQTALVKLISQDSETKNKYEMLGNCLNSSLKRGNAVKNAIKLQNDFYFSLFHPMNHYSLQVILWDLPRLSSICRDEWIPVALYKQFLSVELDYIPFVDGSNSLSQCSCSTWVAKATTTPHADDRYVFSETDGNVTFNESQKKFIPAQDNILSPVSVADVTKRSHLVVVASLIDKAPNLGGLTRTSEIFAVSALVVDNLDIARSKEFTSLSTTAEKHVPLIEVKQYSLFNYLKHMKEEQYCIIGAEQVTNSKRLGDFTFPLKSVLVLGNEKEGIPASLLPVLDVCVEIPQMGVIRSLNVHVSASLMIWEYAKQHLFA